MVAIHTVTAAVAITRPAYDVKHAAVTAWATGFETGDHSLEGNGWTTVAPSTAHQHTNVGHSGTYCAMPYSYFGGTPPVAPFTATWSKAVTGLTIGRAYTFTAWVSILTGGSTANRPEQARLGVVGFTASAYVTLTSAWKMLTFTFVATATSHTLQLQSFDSVTGGSVSSLFYVDDMALVQDAWTEHFPAVTSSNVAVDVVEATLTLDDSWAPYCQVRLTCWTPPEEVLEFIDPRTVSRVTITVTDGTVTRPFNLMLRSRTVDHTAGQMTLVAESDESQLMDMARVATTVDNSAAAHQASLRTLINTVVLAPIGAVLEADNGADANLTIFDDQTNLVPNPSAEVNTTGWTATACTLARTTSGLTGVVGAAVFRLSAPSSAQSFISSDAISVTPGQTYVASAMFAMVTTAASGTQDSRARTVQVVSEPGGTSLFTSPQGSGAVASVMTRLGGEFTVPAGVTAVKVRLWVGSTVGEARWDAVKFAEKSDTFTDVYFDGDTPDTADYTYAWTGTAHASTSTRVVANGTDRDADMFRWVPGVTAWDFVEPLVQAGALRLFCDEARKWHLVDPALYTVPGLVQISAGTNAKEADDTITRYGEWFDSVVIMYQWTTADGLSHTNWDIAGAPGTKTILVEKRVPFPGPGAAAALLKRSKARGRVLDLTAVSDYKVTPGMSLQSSLPNSPTQSGLVAAVTWDLPADQMDVTSRGLGDLPSRAWLALAPGFKWTDSPVGDTWNS
jgi:hypothetical protein